MKTIQVNKFKSSNLNLLFSSITSIEIEDNPFDRGAFGEVYISKKINGRTLFSPQVIKVFIDDGSGSAIRGLATVEQLQVQIINLNNELKKKQEKSIEDVTALGALPQFSFNGILNAKIVLGYSANLLDSEKWLLFDKIFNESDIDKRRTYRNNFYNLPLESRLAMAYNLAEGFSYLKRMNFVYADLNPKNFFVNENDGKLCLIDYEGGAVMDSRGNTPETYGKLGEWLAPEIQEQLRSSNSGLIKVNLHTDTWAVAIGIHFLIFPYHPIFYLETRGEKEKEYLLKNKWPQIDKRNSNYRKEVDKPYDKYIVKLQTQTPQELVNGLSETINYGYTNPNKRLSYKQWMTTLGSLGINPPILVPKPPVPILSPPKSILITAISNNSTFGTISVSGNLIIAMPNYQVGYASPAYEITKGKATVRQSGNKFTVTASTDCEIRINFEVTKKWYQKWQPLSLAAIVVLCLILGAFLAIKSLSSSDDPKKEEKAENCMPPLDYQMLTGDYTAKYKIDGKPAGDIMNGYIEAISQNEYRITIYSDYDPVSFSFTYNGKTISSPDIPETKLEYKGNRIIITFKKDNQLWEFTKRL